MIRTIAFVTIGALLVACETTPMNTGGDKVSAPVSGAASTSCTSNSSQKITIKYGDSSIDVTHKINVKKGKNFKLILNPSNSSADPVDYTTMNVYLFGSTTDAQWLTDVYNAGGQNSKEFDICASADEGEYKYMVVIPGIGTIDPRVEIKL
jgi:hypothetical protein